MNTLKIFRGSKFMNWMTALVAGFSFVCFAGLSQASETAGSEAKLLDTRAIDFIWSGHRVKPYLLTRGEHQFVAYFDGNRQLTIAHRIQRKAWRYYKVDSWLGWDSHNYVTMELDAKGHLHVMGNMHSDPIEYFRMEEPYNVRSIRRQKVMVDWDLERRMTYPIFMLNKNGDLLVKYRDGGSGNGSEIYNIYNTKKKRWSRLHKNQFLDGQGLRNAYFEGPILGPDGNFHLVWVWRDTPDASTNHSVSYARSPDLVNWTDSDGNALKLPITIDTVEVVDPVPPKGGVINNNVKIGFDKSKQPVISYHKYDAEGSTQMFVAYKEADKWINKQISKWDGFRWDFGGGGSLGRFVVQVFAPELLDDGSVAVMARKKDEVMQFVLNGESFMTERVEAADVFPKVIGPETVASNTHMNDSLLPLELQVFESRGERRAEQGQYYLSWLSQPANRDRAHKFISTPSVLLIHEVDE